jgi:hypothetical protein
VPKFLPGVELARALYAEVIAPLVHDVPHAAARMGWGSDVLGYDTERSTDHGWGPRVQLFVRAEDVDEVAARVERGLPEDFRGWPARFGWHDVPVQHHVDVVPLEKWLDDRLGLDPRRGVDLIDWLALPQQLLLETTSGAVFHDPEGELSDFRGRLSWYPDELWFWLLACQWRRVDQEEPFVGRTAEVGDELGSRVLAARLARDLVRLCFLLERRYARTASGSGPRSRRWTRTRGPRRCSCARSRRRRTRSAKTRSSRPRWRSRAATTPSGSLVPCPRTPTSSTVARTGSFARAASSTPVSSGSPTSDSARCR